MSTKIIINGKEYDNAENLSPELRELLADKDGNGIPDIADNPFAALGKLGQMASLAKDMPVLVGKIKAEMEKQNKVGGETGQISVTTTQSADQTSNPPSGSVPKPPMQDWLSASPPIKKDTGRKVIFIAVILGLAGWYAYQYLIK